MKDELFKRECGVPMTKEAVRLLALERLALDKAQRFVDVGAGTGSISLEAALRYPDLDVIAIERNVDALDLIANNSQRFGCGNLRIFAGTAPMALNERVDAVFIGGSGGMLRELIDWALERLTPDGRLVMSFILLENLSQTLAYLQQCSVVDLDCCEIQVNTLTPLGQGHYFKPNNFSYLISCRKEKGCA